MNNKDKKRILVVSPADSFFTLPHVGAFQVLGYDCISFDNRNGKLYSSPMLKRLIRVIPWLRIIKKNTLDQINKRLISLVKEYKPFLVFSVKAENIYPETIREIRKSGAITAIFFIDLIDHWELIKKIAPAYDYFFNQDYIVLNKLWHEVGLKNSFYMAHATEPSADPFTDRQNKYNVAFVGTHSDTLYASREKYLLEIKDLGLNIWGTDGWVKTPLTELFHGSSVGEQRFGIYEHSKIVVDINWNSMLAEGLSNRPFEVTGCGALFMTDNVRADIYRAYEVGKEVVVFTDENDLRDKVKYYLEHEKERDEIARAGYAKTVAKHTYVERVKQLLDTINSPKKYLYK